MIAARIAGSPQVLSKRLAIRARRIALAQAERRTLSGEPQWRDARLLWPDFTHDITRED